MELSVLLASLPPFNQLSIVAEAANVTVRTGDACRLETQNIEDDLLSYEVKGGKLTMQVKYRKHTIQNVLPFLHISQSQKVTITLPADTSLQDAVMELSMGNVHLEDLSVEKGTFSTEMGNAHAEGCKLGEVSLTSNMGNIHVEGSTAQKATCTSNMGNVHIEGTQTETALYSSNMGNVHVEMPDDLSAYTLKLNTTMGNVKVRGQKNGHSFSQEGTSGKSITASTEMGNVSIE